MTLVEINSKTSKAFMFKTFEGEKSKDRAENFCRLLNNNSKTLNAFIVKKL